MRGWTELDLIRTSLGRGDLPLLYTGGGVAQDTSRDGVELYYLPAEGAQANQKYALVIGGNAIVVSAEIREGISTHGTCTKSATRSCCATASA